MVGLGTLVNSGAILAGAGAGLLLRRGLPEKWQESIMQGVALCIIVIGCLLYTSDAADEH